MSPYNIITQDNLNNAGMGVTHAMKTTYPRLADVIGFCTPEQGVDVAEKIMLVQRDNGNRANRKNARVK